MGEKNKTVTLFPLPEYFKTNKQERTAKHALQRREPVSFPHYAWGCEWICSCQNALESLDCPSSHSHLMLFHWMEPSLILVSGSRSGELQPPSLGASRVGRLLGSVLLRQQFLPGVCFRADGYRKVHQEHSKQRQCCQGSVIWILWKVSSLKGWSGTEQSAWRGDRVTIPGSVQKMRGCGA